MLTVLLVSFLILVVCLGLATLCIINLNISSAWSTSNQSFQIAQAAVAQFWQESDRFYQNNLFTSTTVKYTLPDWKERFRQPVFPTDADRFPGEAFITFDPSKPNFSIDNSGSNKPAAGWRDVGHTTKSVPPYAVDLLVRVDIGGTSNLYEAILRRRWPYVLTCGGQVKMLGTPPRVNNPPDGTVQALNPSLVLGPVYSVAGGTSLSEGDDVDEKVVPVSYDLADVIDLSQPIDHSDARVVVGMYSKARTDRDDHFYLVKSANNELHGRVDVMQALREEDALFVVHDNVQDGGVRTRVKPSHMLDALKRALRVPPSPKGVRIPDDDPLPQPWRQYFELKAPGDHYVFDRTRDTRFFYFLKRDVTFPPPELPPSGDNSEDFEYSEDRQFLIPGSAGNRYYVPKIGASGVETRSSRGGIRLDNCLLYVDGNLDLSSTKDATSGNTVPTSLVGINATLIVNGNLTLTGADIDAQDRGMVIYAKRLVGQSRGHFRGLIMVQRSMALFPPDATSPEETTNPNSRLTVTGGIVCGGQDTRLVIADDPTLDTQPGHEGHPPTRVLQGINLWSTTLEYDPQYLSTMHKFGPLTLMSLRRL